MEPGASASTAANPVTVLNVDVVVLVVLVLVVSAASCICTVMGYFFLERINVRRFFRTPEISSSHCHSCSRRRGSPRSDVAFSPGGVEQRSVGRARGRRNLHNSQSVHPNRKSSFRGVPPKLMADHPPSNEKDSLFGALGISTSGNGQNLVHPMAKQLENRNLSPIQQTPPNSLNGIRVLENVPEGFRLLDLEAGDELSRATSEAAHSDGKPDLPEVGGTEVSVYMGADGISHTTASSEYDVHRAPEMNTGRTGGSDDIYSKIVDPDPSSTQKLVDTEESDSDARSGIVPEIGSPGRTAPARSLAPFRLAERAPTKTMRVCGACGVSHCCVLPVGLASATLKLATPVSQFAREINFNERAMMKDNSIRLPAEQRDEFQL